MSDDLLEEVKSLVGDPVQAPAVHDLLHHAVAEMVVAINGEDFPIDTEFSNEELARRTDAFEALAAPIVRACAWGGFYGDPATRTIWPGVVGRAANTVVRTGGNHDAWRLLDRYPAVLMMYAVGIGAAGGDRPDLVAALLQKRAVLEREALKPIALELHAASPFVNAIANRLPGMERHHTPASDRVYDALLPRLVDDLISGEQEFASLFDRFEYVLGLVRYDISRGDGERGAAAAGRFVWRREEGHRIDQHIRAEIAQMSEGWPLLREGLFRGSTERLTKAIEGLDEVMRRW
jgi:hypothetical protein